MVDRPSPVVAGGGTLFLAVLATTPNSFAQLPWGWGRVVGRAIYYVAPASIPDDLLARGFGRVPLSDPAFGTYALVLMENALYAAFAVLVAGVLYRDREIPPV